MAFMLMYKTNQPYLIQHIFAKYLFFSNFKYLKILALKLMLQETASSAISDADEI